jgi:hypothetical protein
MKSFDSSVHHFSSLDGVSFCPNKYSRLKFGCNEAAFQFGHEMAQSLMEKHSDVLLANRCVVIPSPYNYVENAATIMTRHFVNALNHLLVSRCGEPVEYVTIQRKVSYISDYGFLSAEKRKGLLDGDEFYLPTEFLEGKLLILTDDVKITGAHEEKLKEVMDRRGMKNDRLFSYYGKYEGDDPTIEARINFAAIRNPLDLAGILQQGDSHVIVRPLKYILGLTSDELKVLLKNIPQNKITAIYSGCLAEGYFKIPSYQKNFGIIKSNVERS